MTWYTGTSTDFKDLLNDVRAHLVTEGWTVDEYSVGDGKARGILTLTGNALNGETVTVDTKVYTFQTTLTDVDGNVLIGATASDSLDNLIAAITLGAGSGTLYAASTTVHPTVTAAAGPGDTLNATAKTGGTAGNSIATTETLTSGAWGGATLTGGLALIDAVDELYVHGPGPTANEDVHVNIRTVTDVSNGHYAWEMKGATVYQAVNDFDNQPGGSPSTYLLLWENSITYWLSVNDRRFLLVAKVSTRYFCAYAGFFLPYATPVEYPYPLYIAAAYPASDVYTISNARLRVPGDPGDGMAYMRTPGGAWVKAWNHQSSANEDNLTAHVSGALYTWPMFRGGSSTAIDMSKLDWRSPASKTVLPLFPIILMGEEENDGMFGDLEGYYFVPGFGVSAEQTFSVGVAYATGTLTLTGNALNGETVTVDTKVYTFQTTLTDVDGNVLIGATASDSLDNLIAAINASGGGGTTYAASTIRHPTVWAAAGAGDTMDVTARSNGTGGNSLASTETLTSGSWGGALLSGGTDQAYMIFPNVYRTGVRHFFAVAQV